MDKLEAAQRVKDHNDPELNQRVLDSIDEQERMKTISFEEAQKIRAILQKPNPPPKAA